MKSPEKLTGVKHRLSPQSVQIPLFRYFVFVGGLLLSLLFIANAYLPASRVDGSSQPASKPTILIDSSRKWPERIVYDTNLPTTVAVAPAEEPVVVPSQIVRPSPQDSMAQLAAPTPPQQTAPPNVTKEKRVKIAKRVSRSRFAYVQQQRRPPDFFASWW
jgi:hypothetical protein